MNRVLKRKPMAQQARNNKALYLPMERSVADGLVLPVRVALESIRRGRVERDAVVCLSEVVLLTGFLAAAGHSRLDQSVLDDAEKHLLAMLDSEEASSEAEIQSALLDTLTSIVNEYDRVLRESRLLAIVEANEHFTRLARSAIASS